MKKIICLLMLASVFTVAHLSLACVGRTVHLGISNTANEKLMAELASLLIIERTGSTVQIDIYKDSTELYKAVKQGNVNFFFETPSRAAEFVGKAKDTGYAQVKSSYRTKFNMTWLEPGPAKYSPVLTADTLATYPALPKLLNKLSKALENDTYLKLLKNVESGDNLKKVAKDFLKNRKLI